MPTEKEMLDEATSQEGQTDTFNDVFSEQQQEPAAEDTSKEQERQTGENRDEKGRFTARAGEETEDQETAQETDEADTGKKPNIPPARLKSESDRRRAAETALETERREKEELRNRLAVLERTVATQPQPRQSAQSEQKAELPDPLVDPEGYRSAVREGILSEIRIERFNDSMAAAQDEHGDLFMQALAEANRMIQSGDQATRAMLFNARDPGRKLISWFKEREAIKEVGSDPQAYFNKQLEAFLADPANQAKVIERIKSGKPGTQQQQQRPANRVELPPSLNNAANAASRAANEDDPADADVQRGIFADVLR